MGQKCVTGFFDFDLVARQVKARWDHPPARKRDGDGVSDVDSADSRGIRAGWLVSRFSDLEI